MTYEVRAHQRQKVPASSIPTTMSVMPIHSILGVCNALMPATNIAKDATRSIPVVLHTVMRYEKDGDETDGQHDDVDTDAGRV